MQERPRENIRRFARLAIVLLATAAACWLVGLFAAAFNPSAKSAFDPDAGAGTAAVPYSDALGPWLDSSMSFYLRGVPLSYLYHPAVGLFYSTIISATNSVASVPVVWIALFLAGCAVIFFLADWPHRAALVGIFSVFVVFFNDLILPLNPATLMADFWPMALSLLGIWLIALETESPQRSPAPIAAGFLLLGIAGAVRGPQLACGAALLVLLGPGWARQRAWRTAILAAFSLAAPFVVESVLKKVYGLQDDGFLAFYNFYSDPQHHWSAASQLRYAQEDPPLVAIASHYVRFLFSAEGLKLYYADCLHVIFQAAGLAGNAVFLQALGALALMSWLAGRKREPSPSAATGSRWPKRLAFSALTAAVAGTLYFDGETHVIFFSVLVVLLALFSIVTGRRLTAMLTIGFCAGLAFHAGLGLTAGPRVIAGYEILLFAAFASAVTERPHTACVEPRRLRQAAWTVFVLVLVGYTGNFWLRTGFKAGLRTALAVPQTAMKLSDSKPLDRSLYVTGTAGVFYTRYDPLPFGTVRTYRRLDTPEGMGCATCIHPCGVEWLR